MMPKNRKLVVNYSCFVTNYIRNVAQKIRQGIYNIFPVAGINNFDWRLKIVLYSFFKAGDFGKTFKPANN